MPESILTSIYVNLAQDQLIESIESDVNSQNPDSALTFIGLQRKAIKQFLDICNQATKDIEKLKSEK